MRDIREHPEYIQELMALQVRATPATVIRSDGGDPTVIVGFRPQELSEALGLHAGGLRSAEGAE